ncbi:transcription factor bHLH96-like [Quillaja saponaria]|uniref:Transcription factor bHLH96-like n=1 Tax=Quillaja saponaria TaxID=32244 RepID=A0AAD7PRY8_QUISA|nr:transcription factor bHLH96-like [Quillaja saponaria]
MALEAVVFPQDPFSYGCKDFYSSLVGGGGGGGGGSHGGAWSHDDFALQLEEEDKALSGIIDNKIEHNTNIAANFHANWDSSSSPSVLQNGKDHWATPNSSPEACCTGTFPDPLVETRAVTTTGRRKRRRTRSTKNKEEIENQRMTHIAVERNRRKQMNDYLAVLRSLMPPSYVQRGDQASIVGGAINFLKELEQLLQSMEGHKTTKQPLPFAEFFTFPQYSTRSTQCNSSPTDTTTGNEDMNQNQNQCSAVADIEVTVVDSHANLKILTKKLPRQLLKMVVGFQSLGLSILHLNVSSVDQIVLYSLSVKLEEGCQLNTVDEIAAAVNQLLRRIQEEVAFS